MQIVETLDVQGCQVRIDGHGADALLMLHGWPDTLRLWDGLVDRLRQRLDSSHRCVRFTLPGFEPGATRDAASVERIVALMAAIAERVSPDRPLTLVLHDWGCLFGYAFAQRHPQRVARIVAIDIGDAGSPAHLRSLGWRAKLGVAGYQLWLALAWRLAGLRPALGDRMARAMARWLRCPTPADQVHAGQCYPYDMAWTGSQGGLRGIRPPEPQAAHSPPTLYVFGRRKPFQFHSRDWAQRLAAQPGNRVQPMATGHWVMVEQPEALAQAMADWLAPKALAAA